MDNRITRYAHLDDHTLFIEGVRGGLQPLQDTWQEAFTVNSEEEFWRKALQFPVDVLITDYNHNSPDPALFLRRLKASFPKLKVLLLTMMSEPSISPLLQEGLVDEYLPKSADHHLIVNCLKKLGRQ